MTEDSEEAFQYWSYKLNQTQMIIVQDTRQDYFCQFTDENLIISPRWLTTDAH